MPQARREGELRLAAILAAHDVEDIAVLETEVPCCLNLEAFVRQALKMVGKEVPVRSFVLGIEGEGAWGDEVDALKYEHNQRLQEE